MPLICRRCGKKVGLHLLPSVRKACETAVPANKARTRATANKAISRLHSHKPPRTH